MKNIVQNSVAVAWLPLNVLISDLEAKTVAVLPLRLPIMQGAFSVVRLARPSLSPLEEFFVRRVLEVDADVTGVEDKATRRQFPGPTASCPLPAH